MLKILMKIWEFPQNLLGFIVKIIVRAKTYCKYKDATVYTWGFDGGMSLGKYIFVPFEHSDPNTPWVQQYIKHEYGHSVQSKYLGWFYLLVIGLPSLIWAGCYNLFDVNYCWFYTEKWADKLGGVK